MKLLRIISCICLTLSLSVFSQEMLLENKDFVQREVAEVVNTPKVEENKNITSSEIEAPKIIEIEKISDKESEEKKDNIAESLNTVDKIIAADKSDIEIIETINEVPYSFVYSFILLTFLGFIGYLIFAVYQSNKKYETMNVNLDTEMEYELLL